MRKWVRENPNLWSASAFLVLFLVFAIASLLEWQTGAAKYLILSRLTDAPRYVIDGAFALFFLGLGLTKLWQWRQQQLHMAANRPDDPET